MDLLRAFLAQQLDDARAGRAAHDGIIDHHDSFAPHDVRDGVQLDLNLVLAALLPRLDEGTANIKILDKANHKR